MRKYFILAAAATLSLASCSDTEYLGVDPATQPQVTDPVDAPIEFGSSTNATTRASIEGAAAAAKLGGKFTVYGYKGTYNLGADYKDVVFPSYEVSYTAGTAGTTASNSADWEYVDGTTQVIKYWDYSAPYYNFLAWSSSVAPTISTTDATADNGDKLVFSVSSASAASDIYIADRFTATPAGSVVTSTGNYDIAQVDNSYNNVVKLNFRSLGTKVRVGIYETVPGYEVSDVVFYEESTQAGYAANKRASARTANTYVNGDYKQGVSTYGDCPAVLFAKSGVSPFGASGEYTVTFNHDDNVAEISTSTADVAANFNFGSLSRSTVLGTTSAAATIWSGTDYVAALPMSGTDLYLKVDYTLTSLDASHETIRVQGATAVIPAQYTEWKSNYAYTYIFKISDNTNGYTSGDNPGEPDDPEEDNPTDPDPTNPDNPSGLYPITFDAVVAQIQESVQETVTTIAEASITTYQRGSEVTSNSEYKAGADIYVNAMTQTSGLVALTSGTNAWLYTATTTGEEITEDAVAKGSTQITLTDVTSSLLACVDGTDVPTVDGYTFNAGGNFLKFSPVDGMVYVVKVEYATDKFAYKVIRMTSLLGTATTYAYSDGYTYTGAISVDGNVITFTSASYDTSGAGAVLMMNDLARYLGALYREDGVQTITFAGTDYTWDPAGTLKGSNYTDGATTLVAAITTWFAANPGATVLDLTLDGAAVQIKFQK